MQWMHVPILIMLAILEACDNLHHAIPDLAHAESGAYLCLSLDDGVCRMTRISVRSGQVRSGQVRSGPPQRGATKGEGIWRRVATERYPRTNEGASKNQHVVA